MNLSAMIMLTRPNKYATKVMYVIEYFYRALAQMCNKKKNILYLFLKHELKMKTIPFALLIKKYEKYILSLKKEKSCIVLPERYIFNITSCIFL